jgi:hypothetical protein
MVKRSMTVLLLGAVALVAGCGGSEDAAGTQSQEDNARDTARTKLEQCLRDNGVDPPGGGAGITQLSEAEREKFQEAIDGPCAEYREDAIGDLSPEEEQELQDARVRFQDCMRDEGIDVPSPGSGGGLAQIDPDDPDVQAAMEKCQAELPPQIGGGRPGGGGG